VLAASAARGGTWVAIGALVVGAGLRFWNLRDQVLVGDERWDPLAALHLSLGEILTGFDFARANYSPPLAAIYDVWLAAGGALSELGMRAPALACGLVAIVAIPLGVRRWIGPQAALLLGWLLALSPALVWYSRLVRMYMPAVLVGTLAVIAFLTWRETRTTRAATAYLLLAWLATFLHLLALPFVLAPFVVVGVEAIRGHLSWKPVALLGAAVTVAVVLTLAPSHESLRFLLERTSSGTRPDADAFGVAALRLSGTHWVSLAAVFYAAAARGLVVLLREQPRFAHVSLVVVVVPVVVLAAVVVPPGIDSPVLLARYSLLMLPWLLVWVAVGCATPVAGLPPALHASAVVVVLASWFATGPLMTHEFRNSSFAHAGIHRAWGAPAENLPLLEPSAFYERLRDPANAGAVIETAWHDVTFPTTAPGYQRLHRQRVIVGSPLDAWWTQTGVAPRNAVALSPDALLASEGRWVIVHRKPAAEEWELRGRDPAYQGVLGVARDFATNYEGAQRALAAELGDRFGPPDHTDDWIDVWDLERVRGGSAP
jgi:hypothetical protein